MNMDSKRIEKLIMKALLKEISEGSGVSWMGG